MQVKAKLSHSSWVAKTIYSVAYNAKLLAVKNRSALGVIGTKAEQAADWLVFGNVQKQLGGRVR